MKDLFIQFLQKYVIDKELKTDNVVYLRRNQAILKPDGKLYNVIITT